MKQRAAVVWTKTGRGGGGEGYREIYSPIARLYRGGGTIHNLGGPK